MHTPAMFYGTPLAIFPPKIFAERYDVIHANFPSPNLASMSAWISSLKHTPAVLTWHNDLPPVTSGAGALVKMHDLVSGSYLSIFKKIIATTYLYSKNSKTLRQYRDKVIVIQHGVDTSRFNLKADGLAVRQRHHLVDRKVILFVGALTRWHSYKGVDVLFKAFKIVSEKDAEARLMVVGGGNMTEFYKNITRDLGLSSKVVFAGRVDDEVLPQYYAACDLGVLPSKDSSEGFGLVLLEAMACGKPVIGSRVGGIPEVIEDGGNGLLIEPNDANSLAKAMITLLSDDRLRARMGAAGRKFAEARDWSAVAEKVESVYLDASQRQLMI
jgi:glycosyltransferase involved in cell wall biosynthesis